jgi:hypothetical protein
MPIQPTSGTAVIPAVSERVVDKYWLRQLVIDAPSLTAVAEVRAVLVPYNSTTGQMYEDRIVNMTITDVLIKATLDPQLGLVCETIFNEIDRQAKLQGLI